MFPPFPQEKAAIVCKEIIRRIESESEPDTKNEKITKIEIEQITKESDERKNQTLMIGVLVCTDSEGAEKILVTNSGISKQLRINDGSIEYVPPIVSAKKIEEALFENDAEIHALTDSISENADSEKIAKRKALCEESLKKVHGLYNFHVMPKSGEKKTLSLREICIEYNKRNFLPLNRLPPTGIGDCCAPKLIDHAIKNSLTPVSMCEMRLENPKGENPTENPDEEKCIPPCDSRCGILLPAMLGLEIIYQDSEIAIVNKQSGLLAVPGRITTDSVEERFRLLFPSSPKQPAVHRLDMETSGIMILAKTKEAHRKMNMTFESGNVSKEYVALIDGNIMKELSKNARNDKYFSEKIETQDDGRTKIQTKISGSMELFFRLDVENRPHQIWDEENGKKAVTEWEILGVERYNAPDGTTRNVTRVLFRPKTGRTHQLRLASADEHGFGCPIVGDTLYGKCADDERLMLHAQKITFPHPATGEIMQIECRCPF